MKAIISIFIACMLFAGAEAQNKAVVNKLPVKRIYNQNGKVDVLSPGPVNPSNYFVKTGVKGVSKTPFATSGNSYGMLYTDGPLSSDKATNTILMTYRGGGGYGGNGNNVQAIASTDRGATWTDSVLFSNGNSMRYPVGEIYNPAGNTDPSNVFFVATGPDHISSDWYQTFLFSAKADGSALDEKGWITPIDTFAPGYRGLQATSNGYVHVAAEGSPEADGLLGNYFATLTGQFVGNSIVWNNETRITNPWKIRLFSNAVADDCHWNSMCFAPDGQHGYYYAIGRDSMPGHDLNNAREPHIWMTNDFGATWTKEPAFNFANDYTLRSYLWPIISTFDSATIANNQHIIRPVFRGGSTVDDERYPAVVDYQGRLHIVCIIEGGYTNGLDSLEASYANQPRMLFDAIYNGDLHSWDFKYLTDLKSECPDGTASGWGTGTDAAGWDHEINATLTEDGKKLFVTWSDSDTSLGANNLTPDVYGIGYNIESGCFTQVKSFTTGTAYEADNYFLHASKRALNGPAGEYAVPMVTTTLGADPLQPVLYSYLDGIYFADSEFVFCYVGVNNVKQEKQFFVSENYPNPFNEGTSIDVQLLKSTQLSITVTNLMGQTVAHINKGLVAAGKHTLTINGSNLTSGVYFYTVVAGNETVTNKMIVK